ncbi:hypothetical protein D3C79_264350 [compost metagenome]
MILKMILAVLLLLPIVVSASEIKNTCWTSSGNNNFNVTLTNGSFSSSKAGAIAKFSYSGVPRYYSVVCWVDYETVISGVTPGITWYDQTKTSFPPSEFGDGFYKLNEDIDVKIVIGGWDDHQVPNEEGIYGGNDSSVPPGIYTFSSWFGGSTSSTITLRLRRDQLGGILKVPANVELFRAFRSIWRSNKLIFNDAPIMSMSSVGQFIPVPLVCTINNGAAIEVDFGDLDNTQISSDGSRYVKTVPLQYRCNTAVTQDIDINLIAAPAAFSSDFITTTLPDDVGVVVRHNGQVVKPNQKFSTTLLDGFGQDELQVAPVARDLTKSITGSFTASATLIMSVQ